MCNLTRHDQERVGNDVSSTTAQTCKQQLSTPWGMIAVIWTELFQLKHAVLSWDTYTTGCASTDLPIPSTQLEDSEISAYVLSLGVVEEHL